MNFQFLEKMVSLLDEDQVRAQVMLGTNKRTLWAEGRCYCVLSSWVFEFDILKSGDSVNLSWVPVCGNQKEIIYRRLGIVSPSPDLYWNHYNSGFIYLNRKTGNTKISSYRTEYVSIMKPCEKIWTTHYVGPWPPGPQTLPREARVGLNFIK